jgi:hypothetical protein
MAKKHRTAVPDFSSHKPQSKLQAKLTGPAAAKAPPVAAPRVKPQATSSKSGRRGG